MITVTRHFRWHWRWASWLLGMSVERYSSFTTFSVHIGPVGLHWSWGVYDV